MEQWTGSVHSKMAWRTHFFFIWRLSRFGKELFKYTPFLFRAAGQGKCNSVCIIEIQMLFIYYITTILILLFHIFETISQHLKWIKCPTNDIVFRCTAIVCSLNVYTYIYKSYIYNYYSLPPVHSHIWRWNVTWSALHSGKQYPTQCLQMHTSDFSKCSK